MFPCIGEVGHALGCLSDTVDTSNLWGNCPHKSSKNMLRNEKFPLRTGYNSERKAIASLCVIRIPWFGLVNSGSVLFVERDSRTLKVNRNAFASRHSIFGLTETNDSMIADQVM
jgi:hypothetical protein